MTTGRVISPRDKLLVSPVLHMHTYTHNNNNQRKEAMILERTSEGFNGGWLRRAEGWREADIIIFQFKMY